MLSAGVKPIIVPIRGGTDGARISFRGLPCPNLSTGGYNFHSIYELIPTDSLEKMVEIIVNIASI
jgi:tripeptide aminopeptidase